MTKKNPESSSSSRRRPTSISSSFKAQNPGLKWKPLLLSGDKFMQIVKLEGEYLDHTRFLCIVNHRDEFCLLGVDEDIKETRAQPTIGKKFYVKFTVLGDSDFDCKTKKQKTNHEFFVKTLN